MPVDLSRYRERFDRELERAIPLLGEKSILRDACEYALFSGGKRIRPILTYVIADAVGGGLDVTNGSLAVEYFHTASLIADDLPSMDDEDRRRDKLSLHKVFGEATAILASYTLISAGYEMIAKNAKILKKKIGDVCSIAIEEVSKVAGISGATGGQFLDLFPPDHSEETIFKILDKKTATLFEISFVLGWLFGGGSVERLEDIKEAAYNFGLAFQIADDIRDIEEDKAINIAKEIGKERAKELIDNHTTLFREKMKSLKLYNPSFKKVESFLFYN